ncbi:MAG: response regulator transcription factor [Proteobacteria bacterium]|nr:response regulator transcription factor [Pseudomonadota bacterium]
MAQANFDNSLPQPSPPQKILIIDDDPKLVITLQYQLETLGFEVVSTGQGASAFDTYLRHRPFSVIVLDVNLPEKDGFTILKEIRTVDHHSGILMLTARQSDQDKIHGLKYGADDYLCKPFNEEELIMRIARIASRSKLMTQSHHFAELLNFGPFRLDTANLTLHTMKGEQELTVLEVDLLRCFVNHMGKVLSRDFLLHHVWGIKGRIETRTVDNHIVKLRRYLENNPSQPEYIISIRGRGYKLVC